MKVKKELETVYSDPKLVRLSERNTGQRGMDIIIKFENNLKSQFEVSWERNIASFQ
jgi:hypothetical protein